VRVKEFARIMLGGRFIHLDGKLPNSSYFGAYCTGRRTTSKAVRVVEVTTLTARIVVPGHH